MLSGGRQGGHSRRLVLQRGSSADRAEFWSVAQPCLQSTLSRAEVWLAWDVGHRNADVHEVCWTEPRTQSTWRSIKTSVFTFPWHGSCTSNRAALVISWLGGWLIMQLFCTQYLWICKRLEFQTLCEKQHVSADLFFKYMINNFYKLAPYRTEGRLRMLPPPSECNYNWKCICKLNQCHPVPSS